MYMLSKRENHTKCISILPFIHFVSCLTKGPQPLTKWVPRRVRSCPSSVNFHYLLFSLKSSGSFLRLLPRLPIACILPPIFPSVTCFRRHFLRTIWPIQLPFLPSFLLLFAGYFSPIWLFATILHFSHDRFIWSPPFFSSTTLQAFQIFLIHFPKCSHFNTTKTCSKRNILLISS